MNLERCFLFVRVQYTTYGNISWCDSSQVVRWRTLRQLAGLKSLRLVPRFTSKRAGASHEASVKNTPFLLL